MKDKINVYNNFKELNIKCSSKIYQFTLWFKYMINIYVKK